MTIYLITDAIGQTIERLPVSTYLKQLSGEIPVSRQTERIARMIDLREASSW